MHGPRIVRLVRAVLVVAVASTVFVAGSGRAGAVRPEASPGHLDRVGLSPGVVRAEGWAIGDGAAPVTVHVYVDGKFGAVATTGSAIRPDVSAAYPGHGDWTGFSISVPASPGAHVVCAYALTPDGTNPLLGCLPSPQVSTPIGVLDEASNVYRLRGWAFDSDGVESIDVVPIVDGVAGSPVHTDQFRGDVIQALNRTVGLGFLYNGNYGFDFSVPLTGGVHELCVRALNRPGTPGVDTVIGCHGVTVPVSPFGALDDPSPIPGGFTIRGWSVDADAAAQATGVHIYVDGTPVAAIVADAPRADVAAVYSIGAAHGFTVALPFGAGSHQVCAYGINVIGTPGDNALLGCRAVMRGDGTPVGNLRIVKSPIFVQSDAPTFEGWIIDPDTVAAVDVQVFSWNRTTPTHPPGAEDSPLVSPTLITAAHADSRPPVGLANSSFANAALRYGVAHGFSVPFGYHSGITAACIYAVNVASTPGTNILLGCANWGTFPINTWIPIGGPIA